MQPTDSVLLRQFVEGQSEEAFGSLVDQYINLVYSVALRSTGRLEDAEEITQAVFIILARKAAQLRHEKALSSWLFQTTRLTANNFIRGEIRRKHREQEAFMQSAVNEPANDPWPGMAPLLDDAVAGLGEKDRRAILCRFYEGRNLREVGEALGVSEDTAQKRVERALEKLRKLFAKRGVDSTTTAIGETISANSVQAAPLALAKAVTATAIAKGAAASASTLTLINGALKIMAWTKTKTAVATGIILILAAGTTVTLVNHSHHNPPPPPPIQPTTVDKPHFDAQTTWFVNNAKMAGLDCFIYANDHHHQWPKSFADLKSSHPDCRLSDSDWEFVSSGKQTDLSDPSHTILFQEKDPRPSPDGNFIKVYVLADGSVQIVASPTTDFTASEQKFGYVAKN